MCFPLIIKKLTCIFLSFYSQNFNVSCKIQSSYDTILSYGSFGKIKEATCREEKPMNILEYENYQEKKTHGSSSFPYITYLCSIPLDFREVPLHWHNEFEIIYVKKGEGIITVDLNKYPVKASDISIIPPGHLHSISQKEASSMEYENIIFNMDLLVSKYKDSSFQEFIRPMFNQTYDIPPIITKENADYTSISSCLDHIDDICRTFPKAYEFAIKGYLYQFFYYIFHNNSVNQNTPKPDRNMDKLKLLIKYIETNYASDITVKTAAKLCNFSESHFMKFFKECMNISFINYLNDYRLSMASRLLMTSTDSILSIALDSGFHNISYFNRSFKGKYGITPSQFRKQS